MTTEATAPAYPVFRVTSGSPTPEELAALAAILTAIAGDTGDDSASESGWNRRKGVETRGVIDHRGNWSGSLLRL